MQIKSLLEVFGTARETFRNMCDKFARLVIVRNIISLRRKFGVVGSPNDAVRVNNFVSGQGRLRLLKRGFSITSVNYIVTR